MAKNKRGLKFDNHGGVCAIQRRLLRSPAYLKLPAQAKVLIHLLQVYWRPDKPVGFGVRQAQKDIPCSRAKALECFNLLQEAGFIVLHDESLFNSREGSRTRTWRLTWLPEGYSSGYDKLPPNDWEKTK